MNIGYKSKSECCGCGSCEVICPHDAISMAADDLGFKYPRINNLKCTDCGLCNKKCNFKQNYTTTNRQFDTPTVYAVRHKDVEELRKSQSGAAFVLFSDYILNEGGVVYGASFDKGFRIKHARADTKSLRDLMRGSKYVQSDLNDVFIKVKEDLKHGLMVMFVGTPCQVANLDKFISRDLRPNLFLVDLLCHGVASPKLWGEYIDYLSSRYGEDIKMANFRDKKFGWRVAKETYSFVNKVVTRRTFLNLYFTHLIHRECCFSCPFTNLNRVGDVSIGDFWHWEKSHTEFNDNLGLSLLLVNNPKGEKWFDEINHNATYIKSNTDECIQNVLIHPVCPNPKMRHFLEYYSRNGFVKTAKKYSDTSSFYPVKVFGDRIMNKIKRFIPFVS